MKARDVIVSLATDIGWALAVDPQIRPTGVRGWTYPESLHFERKGKQTYFAPYPTILDAIIPPDEPHVVRILEPSWDPYGMLWPDEGLDFDLRHPDSIDRLEKWLDKYSNPPSLWSKIWKSLKNTWKSDH